MNGFQLYTSVTYLITSVSKHSAIPNICFRMALRGEFIKVCITGSQLVQLSVNTVSSITIPLQRFGSISILNVFFLLNTIYLMYTYFNMHTGLSQ